MNISGKTEERVFMNETGFDENMTVPLDKTNKPQGNRFSFMLGAFNDGIRLVLKAKRLLHESDETMVKLQRALFNKYDVVFEHSRNFKLNDTIYNVCLDYQQSFRYAKFVAYEKGVSCTLKDLTHYPDWNVKLSAENRKNVFDSSACLDYFKQHTLPTNKLALSLGYSIMNASQILSYNCELALTPKNGAKYLKLEHDRAQSWMHEYLPLKFGNYFKCGYILPLTNDAVYVNDRIFTHSNIGFNLVGHTESPTQPILNLKPGQEVVHDDLGSHKCIANQFRIEFTNLPGLRDLDLKAMWYFDMIYYPQEKYEKGGFLQSLQDFTRLSHGIGINYAISPLISI